ncbi:hypothetical protein EV356DRAFT_577347 [Viridothelium virens]|uniref:Uncharacterized protein n=1 Tax=Viridothelium virens TaxID=1048519 RepID=A0A6A6H726_VIRVR|nr:hypothetical protein EV356DRAFT_577347 [Viridothelium virens]
MSNWLSGLDSVIALKTLKVLPGGWLGLIMILTYALSVGADFVSTLIQSVPVRDRCPFGVGLVVSDYRMGLPTSNGAPYMVVTQAQLKSIQNGGKQGIYAKVNRDPRFSADVAGVLGEWTCTAKPQVLEYPFSTSSDDVVSDIVQHNMLYSTPVSVANANQDGTFSHLVILETSAGQTIDTTFNVRASVDLSAQGNDTKRMQSYECALHDTYDMLTDIQKGIDSFATLQDWKQTFQGSLYSGTGSPASPDAGSVLEQILNSMIMVASGNNYLLNSSMSTQSQGCITTRTWILWELLLLAGIVVLLVKSLFLYWVGMTIRLRILSKDVDQNDVEWIMRFIPGETFEWMAQAVRESNVASATKVATSDVARFYFGKSKNGSYGVTKEKWPPECDRDGFLQCESADRIKLSGL